MLPRAVEACRGKRPLRHFPTRSRVHVAYGVSLIGIVGAGGILIFAGGQVNEFLRAVLFCVLVIAFIIAAKNTMTAFGWGAGAEITQSEPVTKGVVYGVASRDIHRAGIRPHLFLGGDRELVLFSGLIAFVLTFACFQGVAILTGIALWMVALFVLAADGKSGSTDAVRLHAPVAVPALLPSP